MKTSNLIKKSLILGLSISLLGMSVFAQAADDEIEFLDGEPEIVIDEVAPAEATIELTVTTGTVHVKAKKSSATVYLTFKGKKKYNLELASDSLITQEDLVSFDGKIVKLYGTPEKKVFKVTDMHLLADDYENTDSK